MRRTHRVDRSKGPAAPSGMLTSSTQGAELCVARALDALLKIPEYVQAGMALQVIAEGRTDLDAENGAGRHADLREGGIPA